MQLETLEFTLIAKGPIPLPLILWNWASKCLLGIHFHSNFLFIPEVGERREGKGAFLLPGQDHSHLLLRNRLRIRNIHHLMLIEQEAPGTRISWWYSKFTRARHTCLPILVMTGKRENNCKSQKYENNLTLLKAISLGLISIWGKQSKISSKVLLNLCLIPKTLDLNNNGREEFHWGLHPLGQELKAAEICVCFVNWFIPSA